MDRRLRLGLNLPYVEGSMAGRTPRWADIVAMAGAAESIGLDAVWVSDHVGFGDPGGDWTGAWESWTLLSALAASTERVHLGTYVLCTPFRNPTLLAKMADTLDEVSGGRLVLGLGAGWNEVEFEAYGVDFAGRFDHLEDSLRIIAGMLRAGTVTHAGPAARAREARLAPRGPRPAGPPIMVGAGGPRLLRLTAELADRWNGGLRRVDEVPALLARVDEACRSVGRDPATLARSVETLVRVLPAAADEPAEERELRGSPRELAAAFLAYGELGIDELQVQLRPNTVAAVRAFADVLVALDEPGGLNRTKPGGRPHAARTGPPTPPRR
jgi:alkanesulfonate monooxygenase SsuD/methylene tetrahydromethanopterin reductase-like flavin-dependent oxidoreductase (luciferase family)